MIVFKELRFKNFLSYGSKFTKIKLDSNKIINIIGVNGRGKSVFIDAFHYVIKGKPFRKIKVGQIVNNINKKNCLVELDFQLNNDLFTVRRGSKPNIFEILKNGVALNEDSKSSDFQKVLENLLGFDPKNMKNTIIMSSMSYKPFLTLTAAEKRLFVDDILNVDIFTKIGSELKKKFSILKDKINEKQSEVNSLQSNLDIIREMNQKAKDSVIDNVEERIDEYVKNIKEQKNSIEENLKEIEKNENMLDDYNNDLTTLNEKLSNLQEKKKKIDENLNEKETLLNTQLKKLQDKKDKFTSKKNEIQNERAIIKNHIGIEKKQLYFLENNSNCPQCKRDIDDEFKNDASNEINERINEHNRKIKELDSKRERLEEYKVKIKSFEEKILLYREKIQTFKKKIEQFVEKINKVNKEIELNKRNIYKNESDIRSFKKYNSDKKKIIERCNEKIEELKKPVDIELKDENDVLNKLLDKKNELDEVLEEKQVFISSIDLMGDKAIKSYVIDKYIPSLNKFVNEYLEILEAPYRIMFDKNLDEQIVLRGYEKLSYYSFSSGERARCDMALLFAFLDVSKIKNSINTNLLILDEVADNSLDKDGVYGVLNIINRLKTKGYTVYVISHRDEIKDEFDITMEATKKTFSELKTI